MNLRKFLPVLSIVLLLTSNTFPHRDETTAYTLDEEPLVRIGLLRNSISATISTSDGTLVAEQFGEPRELLNTTSLRVSSRAYQPPVYEYFQIEIPAVVTRKEADFLVDRIRLEMREQADVLYGETPETWRVRIDKEIETRAGAEAYVALLTEKGFANAQIIGTKYTLPSDEALELTRQIAQKPKSKVRSLTSARPANANASTDLIRKTSSSRPVRRENANAVINSSLREVVAAGRGVTLSSLKPITVGSSNPRGIVYLNGKRYRGKMEVFVNADGRITVVNVVPIEDYLLGVVPAELSLPQIEAQKAQAVAARTYALGNKDDYADEGFDMVDTVWSQVYKGVAIETAMGSRAVRETRGIYAFHNGKPINAMFTSTCGGRTENSGNIYEFDLPYLRGVHCSLEDREHFAPFMVKTTREPALIRNDANYEFVRLASKYAVNNFLFATPRFDDEYFEDAPTEIELKSWLNQLAAKFNKPFPLVLEDSSKPLKLARILHTIIYTPGTEADSDTLMSEADIDYQLSFLDAGEVPARDRVMLAALLRDGWFSIYSDLTIKPNKSYSRGKILRLIDHIYNKKSWGFSFDNGTAAPTADGKLVLKIGRSEKEISVNPNVFLFRKFGDSFYQVKETALVGGESVRYKTNALGEIVYLEVEPTEQTTVAEKMSPFTTWRKNASAAAVRAGLARYVKGLSGALIDVRVKKQGFSKRAVELEILTTTGTFSLKGGKIRSALKLREQLFVMDKRYDGNGRVTSFSFTGRGWGHGIGMCQYGAYGMAKMGVKYDRILKHYYTDIDLVKAY
jgi:stage II sporulation protein D